MAVDRRRWPERRCELQGRRPARPSGFDFLEKMAPAGSSARGGGFWEQLWFRKNAAMKDFDFQPEYSNADLVGSVLLPRELTALKIWRRKPFDGAHALADLYMLANTDSGTFKNARGVVVEYKPGYVLWTAKGLADRWGWRREEAEKFLVELENSEIISRHAVSQYGKVIILTESVHPAGTERAPNCTPSGHRLYTEGVGVLRDGDGVGGTAAPRLVTLEAALLWFAENGSGYDPGDIREQWLYYDAIRDPQTGDWRRPGRLPDTFYRVSDWRSELAGAVERFGRKKMAADKAPAAGESTAQRLFKLDKLIEEKAAQIRGFEDTQPELAERLEAEVTALQTERKELAA